MNMKLVKLSWVGGREGSRTKRRRGGGILKGQIAYEDEEEFSEGTHTDHTHKYFIYIL